MVEVPEAVRAALGEERPSLPAALEFLSRLDGEYFRRVPPEDAAEHGRLAAELTPDRRARLRVTPREGGRYDLAIVAFDYFAEFAILCGLLAAHGLDIESGHVHTCAAAPPPAAPSGPRRRPSPPGAARKIVDVFRVRPRRAFPEAALLEAELLELLGLVAEGHGDEARERLHRRLVESLERQSGGFAGAVAPVEIEFENEAGGAWTVMRVRGSDTPGFLYALANALAMRGIYVHSVLIESVGREARDRFAIARRDGRRIEDEAEQQTLRLAVALIKQFTHFLPWAPDPVLALRDFDQLLDRLMAEGPGGLELFASPEGLRELARLLGSSAFLWEDFLRRQLDHLRPVLEGWRSRPRRTREALGRALAERLAAARSFEERRASLNELKDEEMLVVDMKHLLDPEFTLEDFSAALTDLADAVLGEAVSLCHGRLTEEHGEPRLSDGLPDRLAVFGLGKYGGREMGYASDLELLFVYGGPGRTERTGREAGDFYESLVKELGGLLEARTEGIFHLDLRLRPHGSKGPLASPLPLLAEYYRPGGGAAAFERQALIKLRPVVGDRTLLEEVLRVRDAFVWSDEPWDRDDALHLRDRQARELVPPGRTNVKYSRGCLIDAEYAVQYLQLLHGRERPRLRTPSTLEALARLQENGFIPVDEAASLREAYLFWRRVSDALRMVHGSARDLLLPEPGSEELGSLARRMGYAGASRPQASEALLADVERHRGRTLALFNRRFAADA
jgi:[glutamine synthetase] adenylyltransferase / [glutamine synthetase]-adenylyl-L-tyrosine phosphorylase